MHPKKWVLLTGATSGIGQATAELLAAHKYPLLILGRREQRLKDLAEKLKKEKSTDVETWVIDVREREKIAEGIQQRKRIFENLGAIINNAGLAKGISPLQEGNFQDWDDMISTNVTGLLNITRLALPYLIQQNEGHVVNIGSIAGRWAYPGGAVYNATKFAVRALSEALRMDLFGKKIRVTNIEPGMVNTEFSLVRLGDEQKANEVYKGMTPLSAKDIAETILWCMERPAHVNVQELVIYPTQQASPFHVHRE